MKELIKPLLMECTYKVVDYFSEDTCNGRMACNKVCDARDRSTNNSLNEELDILF